MTVAVVRGLPQPDPLQSWRRNIVALAVTYARGGGADFNAVTEELYGKAAVVPSSLTTASALAPTTAIGEFLKGLRPKSASARLFERSLRVSLVGIGSVNMPRMAPLSPAPVWLLEGEAVPVEQGVFAAAVLGPVKKLGAICSLTGELSEATGGQAEAIIDTAMQDAISVALDASVFSTAAASALRPAGLFNGIAALTATAGGGLAAMVGDLKQMAAAIATAGGGASLMVFAAVPQAVALAAQVGTGFNLEVVPVPAMATGTIAMVETGAIAYALDQLPQAELSKVAVLHMQDTAPAAIVGAAAAPPALADIATPVRSAWQTNTIALRLIMRTTWTLRAPNMVQWVSGTTW